MNTSANGVVAGTFSSEAAAAEAIKTLGHEGFDPRTLSVVVSRGLEHEDVIVREEFLMEEGAFFGAVVCGLLAAVGVLIAGLDFGPLTLVEGGPLLAAIEAGFGGACFGMAVGSMIGLEHTRFVTSFDAAHIHDGQIWVGADVTGFQAKRAIKILEEAGAENLVDRTQTVAPVATLRTA